MFKLFLAFAVVPIIEIYLFVFVGEQIGALWTIGIVLLTAALGAALAREQGMQTLARIQQSLNKGEMPASDMIDGAMILVAGVVLLTPGFFTDAIGFFLLVPAGRTVLKGLVSSKLADMAKQGNVTIISSGGSFGGMGGFGPGQGAGQRPGMGRPTRPGEKPFDPRNEHDIEYDDPEKK